MTLRQLRWVAIAAPIIVVVLLELVRGTTAGAPFLQRRIVLDGLVVVALVLVSTFMVRSVGRMQQSLERQNEELLALHGAGLDIAAELSLDVVLNKVVERARTLVGARFGALSVVNADGSIRNFITSGITSDERLRIGPPPVGHGLLGVVLNEGERLRLPDIGTDPRSHGFPPNHPVMRSLLAVPISCKGPFVGNLYLSEKEGGGEFDPSDEETLERFAVQAAISIDNAHLHRQIERNNEELLALHGAGLDVTAELSLEVVLDKVVGRARALVGTRYGALSVVDADGSIQTFITSGVTREERARIGPPPVGHGLLGVVLNEGERLRLTDIGKDPRSHGFPPNHPVMHSLLAVPITCKGPFVGNLYLSEKLDGGEFSESDGQTLERFAVQAAIAIDNAHLHRQVADLAVAQERLRIAHEMHDGIAQVLGYVNTKVQAAIEYIRREKTEEGLEQLRELAAAAREAYSDVRESIVDLRTLPSPTRSLEDVLREYVGRWKEQTEVSTELVVDGDLGIPNGIELQVVRIIQESLTNVRKHAKATTARIEVRRQNDALFLTVSDNGVGLEQAGRSRSVFPRFGLSTMRERAESIGGTFSIEGAPGGGTVVRVEVPLGA
ncbi:MAG TPA: GAF domain-containing sensor histidine kinase [Thermoanaerobaculia bacterium]|nr:GAF domain-containing sensor histidine kinase [Thermoanaerobaculia bacterium]